MARNDRTSAGPVDGVSPPVPVDVPDHPLLLTVDDVARLLSVSTRTVWRLLSKGEFPEPVRLGKVVRWRLAEIQFWIDRGCLPPTHNAI